MPAAWWPSTVDADLISAIRSLGKRGITAKDIGVGPLGLKQCRFSFGDATPLSLSETKAKRLVNQTVLFTMASVLASGPKLFVVPPDIIDDLNQVDIPLKVKDYSQPFPAVIVKSEEEYHLVCVIDGRLLCLTVNGTVTDCCTFLDLDRTIESYMSNPTGTKTQPLSDGRAIVFRTDEDYASEHRFRATLNFLLLVTAGGFTIVKERTTTHNKHKKSPGKYTDPQIFKPQNINLWRKRLIDANFPSGEATGSHKSPHWRRAHWRRVAVGVGRTGRELRLIKATLVNKGKLTGDPSEGEYVCQ